MSRPPRDTCAATHGDDRTVHPAPGRAGAQGRTRWCRVLDALGRFSASPL